MGEAGAAQPLAQADAAQQRGGGAARATHSAFSSPSMCTRRSSTVSPASSQMETMAPFSFTSRSFRSMIWYSLRSTAARKCGVAGGGERGEAAGG